MKRFLMAGACLFAAACASNPDETETAAAPAVQAAVPAAPAAAPTSPPATAPAATPAPAAAPSSRTNYSNVKNWLCRPGKADDACKVDLTTTIVRADGSTTVEAFKADPNAPIDCFYVYPTVSLDQTMYSDLTPGPEELNVVRSQLARLGASCRLFAPMYRQFTLPALRARTSGAGQPPANGSPADGAADVDDAWRWYLENENNGRGVVILGHSQGSGQITRLISQQIDGKPVQDRLVSAVILGSSVQVPPGKDVGGSFQSIPVCKSASQFGCVISFSTYRADVPPSANALFGAGRQGNEAVCTNPAALGGGEAKAPKAYFSNANREWVKGKKIDTPFIATPGLITTECVKKGNHHYLEMRVKADPADPRIDDPGTDVMANGKPDPAWGLHLIDANVGMGDLVDVVARQGAAWREARK
jgi:hypothetical protein